MNERARPHSQRTIDEVSLPLLAQLLNLWGDTLERLGRSPGALDSKSLHRAAEATTGLRNRGEAVRFDPLLDHLLQSAASETRLTPFGRALLQQDCVSVLSHQLVVPPYVARQTRRVRTPAPSGPQASS